MGPLESPEEGRLSVLSLVHSVRVLEQYDLSELLLVMNAVGIAELKARLSEHLRAVRRDLVLPPRPAKPTDALLLQDRASR